MVLVVTVVVMMMSLSIPGRIAPVSHPGMIATWMIPSIVSAKVAGTVFHCITVAIAMMVPMTTTTTTVKFASKLSHRSDGGSVACCRRHKGDRHKEEGKKKRCLEHC